MTGDRAVWNMVAYIYYIYNARPWYVQACLCDSAYKRSMPLSEKSRTLSPGGRFPPSFIHQVIIITGLNKLGLYVVAMKMASDAECLGGKHPPKQNNG